MVNRKGFLYLTEFISGISVMAVELGASRLLSPYFSSSQIVWTIIIGTIMIAMALGNIYGGRSADKNPDPDILYRRILIAGIWIALIPVLGKYLITGISALVILSVNENYLIWAALVSCLAVFVFPLFLLGTVTPSLTKYAVTSLGESGRTVGYLGASNTIGSIIGTFMPTFVTIPAVGTAVTFLIFSALLLTISIVYFLSSGKKRGQSIAAAVIFCLACSFGNSDSFAFWNKNLTYEGESVYNYLQVIDNDESTILSTNVLFGVQSMRRKDGKLTGMYYDYALAAPLMADIAGKEKSGAGLDLLILGNGSGTFATQCESCFTGVRTEGVEIDSRITDLAHKYFAMPPDVKVTTYDGRAYLHAVDKKYDVIMIDAYQDISVPFQMSSVEFFREVRSHLKEGGVMVINMNMRGKGQGSINQYLSDTISSVFQTVCTVDVDDSTNRELFASDSADMLTTMDKNISSIRSTLVSGESGSDAAKGTSGSTFSEGASPAHTGRTQELYDMMVRVRSEIQPYTAGSRILTDDKAPVEVLSMRAIDGIIRDEVSYYKKIYKKQGIRGLINAQ